MPEFLAQFLILIFNPIAFLILLGVLFIYLVYRVIKHFKDFYSISLRFKLPRALVDGVLGLLLILLLYDFYGQIVPKKVSIDWRSLALSSMIDKLIDQSIKSNGKDEIFGITAEEWNKPFCIRYKNADMYKYCNYENGVATKDYFSYNGTKYDCPLYEKSSLKECSKLGVDYPTDLGLIDRLINHFSVLTNEEQLIRKDISVNLPLDILATPKVFLPILRILNNPCNYIDKSESDRVYITFYSKIENDKLFEHLINEKKETLRCNKKDKDNIQLYLHHWDNNNFKNDMQLIIKRED